MPKLDHLLHRIWQTLPPRARQRGYERVMNALAPRARMTGATPQRIREPIVLAGALSAPTGLGEAARISLGGLLGAGLDVSAIDLSASLRQRSVVPVPDLPAPRAGPGTLLLFAQPPNVGHALSAIGRRLLRDKRRIGCWVWDLEVVPQPWRDASALVHEIATPSRFCRDAFAGAFDVPVRLLAYPLAVGPRPRIAKRGDGPLTFGAILDLGSTSARKNPMAIVRAFREAFEPGDAVRLHVKLRDDGADPRARAALDALAAAPGAPVSIVSGDFDAARLESWWAGIDVVVSLHRSEGFGLGPAEAMQRGLAVISTDWSATAEMVTPETGWPVTATLVPVRDATGRYELPGATWAEPDIHAAAAAMRDAARDRGEALRRGRSAAAFIERTFTLERFVAELGLTK